MPKFPGNSWDLWETSTCDLFVAWSRRWSPFFHCFPNFSWPIKLSGRQFLNAGLFLVHLWDDPHQKLGKDMPHCECSVRKRLFALVWKWGQQSSIMGPEHAGVRACHGYVMIHQMAGRGGSGSSKSSPKSSPIAAIWPRRPNLLNCIGKGMASIRDQAVTRYSCTHLTFWEEVMKC